MSSKTIITATREDATPALVPKLRFPEFRKAEGWKAEPMGEVYSFKSNNSLSRDKLNYVAGAVKNIHYGDIHTKFSSHFDITNELVPFINESELGTVRDENLCVEGDMIFADASEDMADIGKCIELVRLNDERVVSGLHTILAHRTGDRVALGFGGHLFKSGWVRAQIQKEAQGAKVLGISANRMRNLRLPLPLAKAEQQKIAECLSSLDELMAAQARKVDALKTHKKGLMQQLFPREGETQPRLRFPEFQNAGEWTQDALGNVCAVLNNRRRPITSSDRKPGPYRYYGASGVVDYVDDFIFDERVVLVGEDGAKWGAFERTAFIVEGKFWVNNHAHVLKPHGVNDALLENYLTMVDLAPFVTGAAPPKLTLGKLKEIPVPIPPDEEEGETIATCLSSLDALITAETKKHESLKTHKKGLMQQLFPSPEEVET